MAHGLPRQEARIAGFFVGFGGLCDMLRYIDT